MHVRADMLGRMRRLLSRFLRDLSAPAVVAGLALLGTIAGGLASALQDEHHRDAAAMTFLVTLSGVSMAGIGSAFWGVVAGGVTLGVQRAGLRR
jgi:benzoate membrane transport protein